MVEPWFDPNQFGAWYGTVAGGGGGILGGTIGLLAGLLAPRGIGRRWVMGLMYVGLTFGVTQLLFGAVAFAAGQPWGIWYGPALGGTICTIVIGCLVPVVRARYSQLEDRRFDAEGLRRSPA